MPTASITAAALQLAAVAVGSCSCLRMVSPWMTALPAPYCAFQSPDAASQHTKAHTCAASAYSCLSLGRFMSVFLAM
jgi:hypothetical protein